jgi:hypothetical protein
MKPSISTYEILIGKLLNESVDEKWSKWASAMMMKGVYSENLVELAGIQKPYNQFELKELSDKVLEELGFDLEDQEKIIIDYTAYLLREVLEEKRDLLKTLRILNHLYIGFEYAESLRAFYSLYFAKEDLMESEVQWYWEGADRTNIDEVCMGYIKEWLEENGDPAGASIHPKSS